MAGLDVEARVFERSGLAERTHASQAQTAPRWSRSGAEEPCLLDHGVDVDDPWLRPESFVSPVRATTVVMTRPHRKTVLVFAEIVDRDLFWH